MQLKCFHTFDLAWICELLSRNIIDKYQLASKDWKHLMKKGFWFLHLALFILSALFQIEVFVVAEDFECWATQANLC